MELNEDLITYMINKKLQESSNSGQASGQDSVSRKISKIFSLNASVLLTSNKNFAV